MSKLPLRGDEQLKYLDNKTVYSNPEDSFKEFWEQNLKGKNGKNKPRVYSDQTNTLRREFDPGSG